MGSKRKHQAAEASAPPPPSKKSKKSSAPVETVEEKSTVIDHVPFEENPKGDDLKFEVQLYDLLSSEDATERQYAALAIISGLFGGEGISAGDGQGEFKGVSAATLQKHLERRLCRGLASGRKGARLGYSVVLTEVLAQLFGGEEGDGKYEELGFEKVVDFLLAKTKPEGDLSGQEEKDHYLGLLFGLQSFVRAKVIFGEQWGLRWAIVLESLIQLAEKKSWIREECGWVIMEALEQMEQDQAEMTIQKLVDAKFATSPEGVGIWLKAQSRFPDMRLPSKPWGSSGDPLQHLKTLGLALKESSNAGEGPTKQKGNWNPKLHFVWDVVLARYIQRAAEEDDNIKSDFRDFWKVAVDECLFSESASKERKFWGFLLFQKMLQDSSEHIDIFENIFSANLIRCLLNHQSRENNFLHQAAKKSLKAVLQVVQAKPHTADIVLENLVSKNDMYNFDRISKTKTIETILSGLSGKQAEAAVEILLSGVTSLGADETKEAEARRQLFGDYVLLMIRRSKFSEDGLDHDWIKTTALPSLAKLAYCSEDPKCTPPLSEKSRNLFRERLSSVLAYLISVRKGFSYPSELLKKFTPDVLDMDSEVEATKDKALSTMKKLLKKSKEASEKTKGHLQALALLYALVIFQIYNGDPDAVSVVGELQICYDKLIKGKDKGDTDIEASEILVEILLSFVSKPSQLLRKTAENVFSAFSEEISWGGLQSMIDVLQSSESLKGQQELFDQEQDDEMDVDDDEESDEIGSDVEVVDMEDEDDEEEDEDEEDEEDDADDDEAEKLDAALAQALGTHRLDADLEAESSDSDADMSDSEMMALDSKLVEIFKHRKQLPNKKKEKKDAKENMVNFKSRVLDLLAIYTKQQTTNPKAYKLLLPLLALIRTSSNKDLVFKTNGVIIAFAAAAKKSRKEPITVDVDEQIALMKAIHEEASKDPSHVYVKAASTASQLVASNLFRADKGNFKKIATVYRDTEVACIGGKMKIHASFFHEWVNWFQSHCST